MLVAIVAVLVLGLGSAAMAAPSLPITKPPVQSDWASNHRWTGPPIDPEAIQGQWFQRPDDLEEVRTHEFHDNSVEGGAFPGGGGWASYLAIEGYSQNIVLAAGKIVSFDILATITNDTPALSDWEEGTNSHDEWTEPREQYEGPLLDTKLTGEFSIADLATLPAVWTSPYRQGLLPYIIATNEDQLAWYCWTPDMGETPWGDYYVPTWDFGDIPQGASASRLLTFVVDGAGIALTDPRYAAIMSDEDLLLNRTTSLKISTWIDDLTTDTGIPYPDEPLRGSDVSVFHNIIPEPMTLSLLAFGAIAMLIRRRRA
jgi:hypothetical protein